MTHENHGEKKGERHRLPRAFHFEAEPLAGGGLLLVISGAKKVLSYTADELRIDLGRSEITVRGKTLFCRSFSSGVMEIRGAIDEIRFGEQGVKK